MTRILAMLVAFGFPFAVFAGAPLPGADSSGGGKLLYAEILLARFVR